jgi:glycerol-3-phosphate dehydrogenase
MNTEHKSQTDHYDICIIGGGINGAGIARDAAGRGLSVLLVEAQDLAGATSSASTKLIHGGLRYLEHYEFGLVRKSLKEREVLMGMAPHIIYPLQFILPHNGSLRPKWMIRCGLFLYDFLADRKKLQKSQTINLRKNKTLGQALQTRYETGFSYADCWVDDARLVILNAMDAARRGAHILTRTACTNLSPDKSGAHWRITLQDLQSGKSSTKTADKIVNAGGPWVRGILEQSNLTNPQTPNIRLVKGSHIIVKKRFAGNHCYILQQPDGRIVFTIPYENDFTLIGTTDEDFEGDPTTPDISADEIDYLLAAANASLKNTTAREDIISTYSGVRPLFDDGDQNASAVTRDYRLILDKHNGAPILSVFGGKLTTYRQLAEEATNMISDHGFWTKGAILPGGDILNGDFNRFVKTQKSRYSALPAALIERYAKAYGTSMDVFLNGAKKPADLGKDFGHHIYQTEIDYLMEHEWALTAEDVLWRRSKLGLHVSDKTAYNLAHYMKQKIVKEQDKRR